MKRKPPQKPPRAYALTERNDGQRLVPTISWHPGDGRVPVRLVREADYRKIVKLLRGYDDAEAADLLASWGVKP